MFLHHLALFYSETPVNYKSLKEWACMGAEALNALMQSQRALTLDDRLRVKWQTTEYTLSQVALPKVLLPGRTFEFRI